MADAPGGGKHRISSAGAAVTPKSLGVYGIDFHNGPTRPSNTIFRNGQAMTSIDGSLIHTGFNGFDTLAPAQWLIGFNELDSRITLAGLNVGIRLETTRPNDVVASSARDVQLFASSQILFSAGASIRLLPTTAVLINAAAPLAAEKLRVSGSVILDATSPTALQVTQAGGGSPALVVDTTNGRLGVGADIIRWSGSGIPVAPGDLGMDVVTGRPQAFVAGAAREMGMLDLGCRVTHSVNQSIPNNTVTALAFDSERYDTDNMHDNAVNNGRITFTTAGKYFFSLGVAWAANATGIRDIFVRLNGATILAASDEQAVTIATFGSVQDISGVFQFAAGDYIEAMMLQSSGGALNVEKQNAYSPEFMAQKIDRGG